MRAPLLITTDRLAIYLNDHLAAATAGRELARRTAGANRGSDVGDFLEGLAQELEEDRDELVAIMDRLGVRTDYPKVAAAWVGEKAGRLKLNGQLVGYSPLSRLIELEGLAVAVQGKLALWRALREVATAERRLDEPPLDRLIARGERQLEGLRERLPPAAREALVGD